MTKAALSSQATPQGKVLIFSGTLDAAGAAALWPEMTRAVAEKPNAVDLSAVEVMDSAGAILVLRAGDAVAVQGGSPDVLAVLERNRAALNQNFARELPLEFRATLKNYYERVAK
jgi:ABC-type transporter Mla MlaB component